jgi:ADP-heptose:LPS heptosyltransferase
VDPPAVDPLSDPLTRERPTRHPGADRGGPVDRAALRRTLVVRADNLGDVVTATPVLRALRAMAPDARIDLLSSPVGALAAPLLPWVDGVLEVSAPWQQLDPVAAAGDEDLLARLRGYTAMLVLTSPSQSPWPVAQLGRLAGIAVRAVHSAEFGGAAATHWVTPPPEQTHQVDRGLHLLAALGIPTDGAGPSLVVPPEAVAAAAALPGVDRFALLAPGASCSTRRYPAERFGAAAAAVAASGLPVRVSGTPSESALVAQVVAAAGHPDVRALPPVPVPEFAALIAAATVAITNNSAGMHLADALGTPVVAVHGGTERLTDVNPRQVPAVLLSAPVGCSPCRQLRCPYDADLPACLDLRPDRVAAAALALALPEEDPLWTTNALPSCPA